MPSPFPGMDPYLEDPAIWPNVHATLIGVTRDVLLEALRPHYFVGIEERVYLSAEDDPGRQVLVPDVYVKPMAGSYPKEQVVGGGTAVAEPIEVTLLDPEIHELRVEIKDTHDHSIVTVIEFVSPTNKVANSDGRRSYLAKRDQVYNSSAHWIEIDLLRSGITTFNRWAGSASDYGVHLSRRLDPQRRRSLLWLIRLSQRLPPIPVPLRVHDGDATLDLQQVLELSYQRCGYDMTIDYGVGPRVPLTDDAHRWAGETLKVPRRK